MFYTYIPMMKKKKRGSLYHFLRCSLFLSLCPCASSSSSSSLTRKINPPLDGNVGAVYLEPIRSIKRCNSSTPLIKFLPLVIILFFRKKKLKKYSSLNISVSKLKFSSKLDSNFIKEKNKREKRLSSYSIIP